MKTSTYALAAVLGTACLFAAALTAPVLADQNDVPHYDKVVIVMMENQQYSTIIGLPQAPYENWLAQHGALLTNSYGCEHPSQPNYLDIFTGSDQNINDDNDPYVATLPFCGENLGAQLLHKGLSFQGYSEDLPYVGDSTDDFGAAPGDPAGTHDYARKHNPWCNYQNDAYPASDSNYASNYLPSTVNQTLDPWVAITNSGDFKSLPTLSIVVPNQQHDDHGITGGATGTQLIADGDAWLKTYIDPYAEWAKTHNSLLIITWDEDDYSTLINKVPTIFYGAHVKTGEFPEAHSVTFVSTVNADSGPQGVPMYAATPGVDHWNVLRTVEDIFRLGHIGSTNKVDTITDIFKGDR